MGLFSRGSDKTYLDGNGYYRFTDSDRLVHRWVAQKQIYNKNRHEYSKPFGEYVVHHRDRNKRNNSVENLEIMTHDNHFAEHFPVSALFRDFFRWLFRT